MGTSNSLQYLIWLKLKAVKIYSIVQSVKLLLALSIYFHHDPFNHTFFCMIKQQIKKFIQFLPDSNTDNNIGFSIARFKKYIHFYI